MPRTKKAAGVPPREPSTRPPQPPDRERIAARAYELYRARGAQDGRAIDDWLAAEGELSRKGD